MTIGNIIEFPNLESFHLFRLGHSLTKSFQYTAASMKKRVQLEEEQLMEDHREYMIIWERYMPRLKEVRLMEDVVWVKREEERKRTYEDEEMMGGDVMMYGVLDERLMSRMSAGRKRRRKVSKWEKIVLTEVY